MSTQTEDLEKSEKKMKRQWRIATFCQFIMYPLVLLGYINSFLSLPDQGPLSFSLIVIAVWGAVIICILSKCAYEKRGTKFLTVLLFTIPLEGFYAMLQILFNGEAQGMSLEGWIAMGIEILLFVWWYRLSLKVRKINKQFHINEMKKRAIEDYLAQS